MQATGAGVSQGVALILLSQHRLRGMGTGLSRVCCAASRQANDKEWQRPATWPTRKEPQAEPVPVDPKDEIPAKPWQEAAQPSSHNARPKEWQRPAMWPARKEVLPPGPDAPHVVLSTKFEEPWWTISRGLKEILVEKGCTVYNPNMDNKEPGHAANICRLICSFKIW